MLGFKDDYALTSFSVNSQCNRGRQAHRQIYWMIRLIKTKIEACAHWSTGEECFTIWSGEVFREKQRRKGEKIIKDASPGKIKEGHVVDKVAQGILGKGTAHTRTVESV